MKAMLKIEIRSKNSKSIYNLLNFLKTFTKNTTKILISNVKIQKQKKVVNTLLTSPHIHKVAQEKFEYRLYKKSFLLILLDPIKFFKIFKKVLNFGFFDIKIFIHYCLFNQFFRQIIIFFNINNFYFFLYFFFTNNLYFLKNILQKKKYKSCNILNLLNIKGRILLQN